jgi:hypothetical protein
MQTLFSIACNRWDPEPDAVLQDEAITALEGGKVLLLPHLAFPLPQSEQGLLSPEFLGGHAKNVSLGPDGQIKHSAGAEEQREALRHLMERFARQATTLVSSLFPRYAANLERARTSYRPAEIAGRTYSPIKDDTRLHVDAFPTRPMRGRRILRLFSNINPHGKPRIWRVGEPFEDMAQKILPRVREPIVLKNWVLAAVRATHGVRSPYDNLMLGLHDQAKLDDAYQKNAPQTEVSFPAQSTWLCFTDRVMHAAMAGQFVLEQTFHLDVAAMAAPERAPISMLERRTGRRLA